MDWTMWVSAGCAVAAATVSYRALRHTRKKDLAQDGKDTGVLMADIQYVKAGVDDIKWEQREQGKKNMEMISRLASVEASLSQANERIWALEQRTWDGG